jgi:alkyl hydroperoxide reductase subunit AhpC
MLTVGQLFPEYHLTAVDSADRQTAFRDLNHTHYPNQWKIYFFWPKDFTFVCPTEIVGFGKLHSDFLDRNTQLIGGSTDSEFVHLAWRENHSDLKTSPFPWMADIKKELVSKLGVLDASGVALRATYIVDPNNIIRHLSINDGKVGRNPNEILRILDALQTDELCPCNWEAGKETIKL